MTSIEFNSELKNTQDKLFGFALKLTKDYQDAQDLFQDAVTRGFRYSNGFETGTNFRAWMSTIIRNTFINKCRSAKRKRTVSEPIENLAYALEGQNPLVNQGEMNMRIQELYQSLDQLNDIYRIPFMMHFQGYEYKDIAEELNIPIGTIKSRLHTARQQLKDIILAKNRLPETVVDVIR
ncbi:RNA polymerase sigma factor [Flavilitoribacter nigricans]|uniref:RNA polymerase subunit sigma n=1 Tax=Flavilitoribacter nigricans (strain ATCC 23147 / DSM 23189 / NBRC 102662 / NCIMB 1420 / SS-2) TaxID=1122177 RepID=A0A2D0NF29_FLAN2|nr:RNA polymerase sigma factor [Flavilitoribacter nigricans]PHN06980.1 hypothetical protein CRP01_08445 [Flavilitoribacter nigricans DSM 23189 = NBRC 102662]